MAGIIIFMGPTGAGKSVQAERLAHERGLVHLSSGQLLRSDPAEAAVLARGELVVSTEAERVIHAAIVDIDSDKGIILDGFPRLLDEAQWLEGQLADWGRTIDLVVLFDVDQATSLKRLGLRQRDDDTPEALAEKWREYETSTLPVVDYYRSKGLLKTVDAAGDIEAVNAEFGRLLA